MHSFTASVQPDPFRVSAQATGAGLRFFSFSKDTAVSLQYYVVRRSFRKIQRRYIIPILYYYKYKFRRVLQLRKSNTDVFTYLCISKRTLRWRHHLHSRHLLLVTVVYPSDRVQYTTYLHYIHCSGTFVTSCLRTSFA